VIGTRCWPNCAIEPHSPAITISTDRHSTALMIAMMIIARGSTLYDLFGNAPAIHVGHRSHSTSPTEA
jgi:hypothetical protein